MNDVQAQRLAVVPTPNHHPIESFRRDRRSVIFGPDPEARTAHPEPAHQHVGKQFPRRSELTHRLAP